ncbi:hypothetical protein SBOR_3001 [Sclerotinia borealis F-4128]|uniref:Translocation protein sec72 n=1 Tax=Sclerotinia borealis (strain F-4128) TaxID=1432307 RepID=W9CPS2_SCLBF|nr:hypothetical protein SBOR_3001 [Sclerotinia borealis F-4128]
MESLSSISELPSNEYTIPNLPELPETTHESITHPRYPSPTSFEPFTKQVLKQYINMQLLKSCALLANSEPARALEHVENAFLISEEKSFSYEISKCYLYRGLCFMGMKRWREARVALVRGVNVRGWGGKVEGLMREAQGHLDEEGNAKGKKKGTSG